MWLSSSSTQPHLVTRDPKNKGLFVVIRIAQCINGSLYAHVIATAHITGDLRSFLDNLNGVCLPNLTAIANHGMPSGMGRKGGVAKRKRSWKIPTIETRSIQPCLQNSQPPTTTTQTLWMHPWPVFQVALVWATPFTSFEQPSLFSFICDCSSSCKYLRAVGSSPEVGRLIDQRGDAVFGSEVEARSADHEMFRAKRGKKKIFHLNFQLSGWALVALSYTEDWQASLSNYLKPSISNSVSRGHVPANRLTGAPPNSWILAEMWLLPRKVRAGAPCHQSRVLTVETNTSRSLKNTKIEENLHNPAAWRY